MRVYFKVSDSKTPYWHISQITEIEYTDGQPKLMAVGVSTYYLIDLDTGQLDYKTMAYTGNPNAARTSGTVMLNPSQVRLLLTRYDNCTNSQWIDYPKGQTEHHNIVYTLFFT